MERTDSTKHIKKDNNLNKLVGASMVIKGSFSSTNQRNNSLNFMIRENSRNKVIGEKLSV
jgi:hypothetical protein